MRKIKLGDVCKINEETYSDGNSCDFVNYLDTSNITANHIENIQHIEIAQEKLPSRARRKVKFNSIIYSTVRPNQRHYGIIKSQPENFLVSTGFAVIDVDPKKIDANFLYYQLSRDEIVNNLQSIAEQSTTAYPSIKPSDLSNLKFYVPSLDTQRKIGNFLYALDDKIALNKKINATLEAMAKTLYDYWFVQFDFPDENGKPYKTSGGKMIYSSELGRDIPVGWEVKTLGELLTENTTLFNQQTIEPTIDLSVMPSSSIALDELSSSEMFSTNLFKMKEGDILFGSIRPYLKKAGIAPCNGVVVGTVHSYQAKKEFDYTFALFTVCRDKFFDYAVKVSTGTRMPIIKSENLLSYKIAYSKSVVKLFNIQNLKQIICKNVQESHRLAALRDWLLPMLMNEQIKFKET